MSTPKKGKKSLREKQDDSDGSIQETPPRYSSSNSPYQKAFDRLRSVNSDMYEEEFDSSVGSLPTELSNNDTSSSLNSSRSTSHEGQRSEYNSGSDDSSYSSTPPSTDWKHLHSSGGPRTRSKTRREQIPLDVSLSSTDDSRRRKTPKKSKFDAHFSNVQTRDIVTEKQHSGPHLGTLAVVSLVLVCAQICALLFYVACRSDSSVTVHSSSREQYAATFASKQHHLQSNFPVQSKRLWAQSGSAIKRVLMSEEPRKPSCIIFVYYTQARDTASCLVASIANAVIDSYGSNAQPSILNMTSNTAYTSVSLDDNVHSKLAGGTQVIVLHDVHHLSVSAARLLHGFCDTDNSPYKDAHFLFTIHARSNSDSKFSTSEKLEPLSEQILADYWMPEMNENDFVALMSRINNNVCLVNKESLLPSKC